MSDNKQHAILLGIMTVILGFGMLTIGGYILYAIPSAITPDNADGLYASNTYTFTGNGSTGEAIYINNTGGTSGCYYINTTGVGKPVGCLQIGYGGYSRNTSYELAVNLTAQINADTDISPLVTAVNTANNTTVITAKVVGTAANAYVTEDSVTNGAWTSATITGGLAAWNGKATQDSILSYVFIVLPIMGLALMILGFSVIFFTLRGIGTGREDRR